MVACFVVVQSLSVRCFVTPWIAACQAYLSFTVSWNLLKFKSIVLMMPSYHFILYCPLPLLPSMFLSIRVFYNGSAFHFRWPKCWSLRIRPSSEYSGLISFGIDWFDLLAVQGTLKSLLQHHNLKASAFFMVLLSHPYMTTEKSIALTIWTLAK